MTDYNDAGHDAYRRLQWAGVNRPSFDDLKRIEAEREAETLAAKITRLRKGVA